MLSAVQTLTFFRAYDRTKTLHRTLFSLTQSVYDLHCLLTHLSTACGRAQKANTRYQSLWSNLSMLPTVQTPTFQQPVIGSKNNTGHCSLSPNLSMLSTTQTPTFQQPVTGSRSDPICLCSPLFKHSPFNSLWQSKNNTGHHSLSPNLSMLSTIQTPIFQQPVTG